MPTRLIPYLKAVVHLLCLAPFAYLLWQFQSGALALYADPIALITHFTGNWAVYILLLSLAVTPIRRLSPKLSNLIRFRRMLGLYAFFYATLHLATYVFLYSGYDLPTVLAGMRSGDFGLVIAQWRSVWPHILDDIQKRRFIQVGFFSWVILLALAVTSPAFVMRGMGGKNWQRLHRLVYIAAVAAVIHFWWLVKVGVRTPWKDTAVLAILLLARVAWSIRKRRTTSAATPKQAGVQS